MCKPANEEDFRLTIRFKKKSTTRIGQVIGWLNSLENDERRLRIEQALIMAYLPISKFDSTASDTEVSRAYWEANNSWQFHQSNLREILNIGLRENQHNPNFGVDNQDSVIASKKDLTYHDAFGEDED
jgi:hypothetical protein